MINYVPFKPIDYKKVKFLLKKSEKVHTFTNSGPVKQLLEEFLEKKLNISQDWRVVCTNSGTSALYVLISIFEKNLGRELNFVTSAFNFPAANVNKLKTSIVDIVESNIPTINWENLEFFDGIIIPTVFGTLPPLFSKLQQWCEQKKKILILDNASSPLSTFNGKNICELGTAAIGSLHETKPILGKGEGGFAVVPKKMYDEFNHLTNFGFDDQRKYNSFGTNAKLSDISAAFILAHAESYDLEQHLKIQNKYKEAIANIKNVEEIGQEKLGTDVIYGNMPIIFKTPISNLVFKDVGIGAQKYYRPLKELPNSIDLFSRIINFPLYSTLANYELGLILKKIEIEAKKM